MPQLIVREPGRVVVAMPVDGEVRVGRQAECELVLADRQASRLHAIFRRRDAGTTIEDLASRHGTFVNEVRLGAGERPLEEGDLIQIGNVVITYRTEDRGDEASTLINEPPPGDELGEAARLRALLAVSRLASEGATRARLGAAVADATLAACRCERALVSLGDDTLARGRDGGEVEIVVSRALIDEVTRTRRGHIAGGDSSGTLARQGVLAAMAAPIIGGDRVLGFLYADDRRRAAGFDGAELAMLTALAQLSATALEQAERSRRQAAVVEALADKHPMPTLLGRHPEVEALRERIARYARAGDTPVLIRGESGTGKELVAQTLHAGSPRAQGPFVVVNCAAIPTTLLESELFGHEKGAFTGAAKTRRGKFQLADGGTLFLDEMGDLDLAAQAKILRAVEEGEIQPVGSEETVRVDTRVIAATHKPLEEDIAAGRFRQDLYYRLAVGEIHLPPPRARGDDVLLLAEAFLARSSAALHRRFTGFSDAAREAIRTYGWPGNVRQLANEIERGVILGDEPLLDLPELRARLAGPAATPASTEARSLAARFADLDATERGLVSAALAEADGNMSEAARRLGISRIMLKRRMERFGL